MGSLKSAAQEGLKRIHLYERAKASLLYELYWRIADRSVIDGRDREITFYRNTLPGLRQGDLIFDIGANQGFKTEIFLRLGARVLAVEPDELGQSALNDKFRKFRFTKKPVRIVGKAISDTNGSSTFWIHEPGSAKNSLSQKWVSTLNSDGNRFGEPLQFKQRCSVETVTLDTLIETYGLPFFIKVDVEGNESRVLRGLTQPVPYLSFEVNLPEFREEGLQCLDLLESLHPSGQFNYIADSHPQLVETSWVTGRVMRHALDSCLARSIDIFWKTVA